MIDWLNFFYNFIVGVALLLSVLGLWFAAIMPGIDRWSKRFFLTFFAALLLSSLFGLIEIILYSYPDLAAAITFMSFLGTLFLSLPLSMPGVYLLRCCGEDIRSSRLFRTVLGLWVVFAALLTTTLFSDVFYHITPETQYLYLRGPWFPLLTLPLAAIMLINLAGTIRRRKQLSRKARLSLLVAQLPMTVTVLVHVFIDIYPLIDICAVLSTLSMYGLILSDQVEQYMNQQGEIAHQRASIMVLQMRPHFIYNTMTSIYYLCDQDPQKAQRVTMDFTTYLRRNFTAIASRDPIPFSDELEHTRAYLAVEQIQFEDSLFVDYDTPHTRFCVPPLTLQPIVENAVKYGMDPDSAPLHISIRTRRTDLGSEIIVEDNGPGFELAGKGATPLAGKGATPLAGKGATPLAGSGESEPHIALANIQQRLEMMCGGKMTIMPREGGGSVVKVTIP